MPNLPKPNRSRELSHGVPGSRPLTPAGVQEQSESIFADGDDDLFAGGAEIESAVEVVALPMPTPLPSPQRETQRQVAASNSATVAIRKPTLPTAVPIPVATPAETQPNPFELPIQETSLVSHRLRRRSENLEFALQPLNDWRLLALVTVSVYAIVITFVAIWGWLRTAPAVAPDQTPPSISCPKR